MKIGIRLSGCFATILLIMLAMNLFTISRLVYLNSKVECITDDYWPKSVVLNDIHDNINVIARALRNAIILEDPVQAQRELDRVAPISKKTVADFEELKKSLTDTERVALLKEINDQRAPYKEVQSELIELIKSNRKKEAGLLLVGRYREAQNGYINALKKMIAFHGKALDQTRADVDNDYKFTRNLCTVLSILTVLLGAVFAYFATRSITGPIAQLVSANARLADGDLTVSIEISGSDEIGQLADSSRRVVANMNEILSKVADTSGQVSSASHRLQATAEQIATAAEEVAMQTSTVATASEEMAATSGDIARNCVMAAESSRSTSASATRGSTVVEETIAGMGRVAEQVRQSAQTVEALGARSEQIGQIVGTIEDIADQTNLLALNAAIEAARAGEQGRGFAVVADEVRALAERTTRATKEIADMIRTIQNETKAAVGAMEEGVAEVAKGRASSEKSGCALQEILAQIDEVTKQINQIATAAEQQTATTGEITTNVHQVTEVVQETARGAGETAAASAELAVNARLLEELVQRFRLA